MLSWSQKSAAGNNLHMIREAKSSEQTPANGWRI